VLVEAANQMPVSMKYKGTTEKYVLREAAKPYLTDTVYKRQKHPFLAPFNLKTRMRELVLDTLGGKGLAAAPFFDPAAVRHLLANEPADAAEREPHYAKLFTLTSLCLLGERYGL
jgi:asparagine synthase (glutamine-hydrolysing)